MRTLYRGLACLLLVCLTLPLSAQAPTVTSSQAIGFDYLDADMTAFSVTRFDVQWDNGAWVSIGIPAPVKQADTLAGASTYKVTPPFTTGNHSVSYRAVNEAGAGAASSPFAFASLASSPAGVPTNVRVVPK